MANRPGTLGLLEALEMARRKAEAGQQQAAPFDLQSTIQGADKAIQQGVFGAVDAIGSEGKRLIDGKFGFEAMGEALPKLAQSGSNNLLEALGTQRGGWSANDLQAERDRANMGQAAGGALDASMLLPVVGPAAKAGIKGGAKVTGSIAEALRPAEIARNVEREYFVPTNFGELKLQISPSRNNKKAAEVEWDWARDAQIDAIKEKPVSAGRAAVKAVQGALARDAKASKQPIYTFSGTSESRDRLYASLANNSDLPYKPISSGSNATVSGMQRKMFGGDVKVPDWAKDLKSNVDDAPALGASVADIQDAIKEGASVSTVSRILGISEKDVLQALESRRPTQLNMGFGFGGKDGEKPLLSALMDVFKGKQAPAANPLDQFTPPTSLDDIFTGGPRTPRADTGPLDPRQPEGPAFNASTPEVGYDGQGFTGLDARLGNGPEMSPSPADGPFAHTFKKAGELPPKGGSDLRMSIFDSADDQFPFTTQAPQGAPPPTSLADLIAQSLKRPDDIPEGDWAGIMGGVQHQNAELARIMSEGKLMSGAEWGGVARPGGPSQLQTRGDPFGVSVNTTDADKLTGIINHSHPHVIPGSEGTQYPASLSLMDLFATKEARGITSLEPEGGFGYAIANPKAPALENAEWEKIVGDSLQASAPHLPGNVFPYSVGGSHVPLYEAEMIAQKALGTAMKRTNMLQQYGYATKNPAQSEAIRQSETAINAGADAAEKSLREVLKARGFTDGQIAALIAQFGSLGAAMGALGMGSQQKGAPVSQSAF